MALASLDTASAPSKPATLSSPQVAVKHQEQFINGYRCRVHVLPHQNVVNGLVLDLTSNESQKKHNTSSTKYVDLVLK